MSSAERVFLAAVLVPGLIVFQVWWASKLPALNRRGRAARTANGGRHTRSWWISTALGFGGCGYFWIWPHLPKASHGWVWLVVALYIVTVAYLRPWSAANRLPKGFKSTPPGPSPKAQAWLVARAQPAIAAQHPSDGADQRSDPTGFGHPAS